MADDGKFSIRPDGAAPLFDPKSGKAAARKRWDAARAAAENAIVVFANASNENQDNHTVEEAYDYVVRHPQFQASLEGKTAAAKFVSQMGDLLPAGGAEPNAQGPQTVQQFNVYNFGTPEKAKEFANQLEEAGEIILAAMVRAQIDEDEEEQVIEVLVD